MPLPKAIGDIGEQIKANKKARKAEKKARKAEHGTSADLLTAFERRLEGMASLDDLVRGFYELPGALEELNRRLKAEKKARKADKKAKATAE